MSLVRLGILPHKEKFGEQCDEQLWNVYMSTCLQRRGYQIDMFTVYIDLKISEDSQMCPCV